jgi:hypothetical protein
MVVPFCKFWCSSILEDSLYSFTHTPLIPEVTVFVFFVRLASVCHRCRSPFVCSLFSHWRPQTGLQHSTSCHSGNSTWKSERFVVVFLFACVCVCVFFLCLYLFVCMFVCLFVSAVNYGFIITLFSTHNIHHFSYRQHFLFRIASIAALC